MSILLIREALDAVCKRKGVGTRVQEKLRNYGIRSCGYCQKTANKMNQMTSKQIEKQEEQLLDEMESNAQKDKKAWNHLLVTISSKVQRREFLRKRIKVSVSEQEIQDDDILILINKASQELKDIDKSIEPFLEFLRRGIGHDSNSN